jgi:glycosyltransferase involved in cell wall biosynthesis
MVLTMRLKRLIRPLIPDRVMARYRLQQHSRHSRVNVDVFLDDPRAARRWLAATPDTYRVRLSLPESDAPEAVTVTDASHPVEPDLLVRAARLLSDPDLGAGVVGEVAPPRLVDRRRAEPLVGPVAIAVRPKVLEEVGGVPPGDHPLPGLLARLRDAGHRLGLVPIPPAGAPVERSDPIDLDPVVILAAVPMHDVGGGARSTQLALEFLRQGHHVTLVSLYEAQESVDLGLRFIHPALEQVRVERFDPDLLAARASRAGLVLVEAPAETLVRHAWALQGDDWELVYDVIDDWSDPALGGEWYRTEVERKLVRTADRVMASAPDLVDRARRMGRDATLVPNAVNAEIFGVDLPPRPHDLPEATPIIGYHGSLYGDWFDWEALRGIAWAFPGAAVVVIGDDKAPHPPMPSNVHFLGLKPQTDLPAYLQHFDVGIIPFRVTDTTHAVSPLKAYEYLASGVPVAAPPLRSLQGLEGVIGNEDLVAATRAALASTPPNRETALRQESWTERVHRIRSTPPSRPGSPTARSIARTATHWSDEQRRHH